MTQQNALALMHILYVEDESMTRDELSRFLKRRVGKLHIAKDGLEALHFFDKETPDILITDLRMPEINGLDLTKQIRAKGSDIPIIITSALSDSETILSAVDRGIVKYIVKPIDAETLENTLLDLAKQIIERKHNKLVGKSILTPDEKLAIEKHLARDISALLKKTTGKGPRRLMVKLSHDKASVYAEGMLTPMETTLLKGAQSPEALTLNRELLYKTIAGEIQAIFRAELERPVSYDQYIGQIREDKEEIIFRFR
ncbi:Na-translocating system protein MpsC family protein [Fusibacter sp. JL216-2]|uniref:Na-translocating system protein MpsC family protein n=1 Tax=Fusibacter sp. JL216-2 TaxID=3071453 RepID=UPI003D33500F